jgi:hypothetical protein
MVEYNPEKVTMVVRFHPSANKEHLAELVDASDLKSDLFRGVGSSPIVVIIFLIYFILNEKKK